MVHCSGLTVRGQPCRKAAIDGNFCAIHRPAVAHNAAFFSEHDLDNVRSSDPRRQIQGLRALNMIRTTDHVTQFLDANILDRVMDLFADSLLVSVRDAALWVLTNLTSTPGDDGARAMFEAQHDFLEDFRIVLVDESPLLLDGVLWCLGNISSSGEQYAQSILGVHFDTYATDILCDIQKTSQVRKNAAFLLSSLSRVMPQEKAADCLFEIGNMPARIFNDADVVEDLAWALQGLYEKANSLETIPLEFLTDLLDSTSRRIINPVLRLIGDICAKDNHDLIERFLAVRLVEQLKSLLHRRIFVRDVLWTFSNLSVEAAGRKRILETPGLLLDIISFIPVDNEAIFALSNLATRGEIATINAILETGAPVMMIHRLQNVDLRFKTIICEGLVAFLTKGGARAYRLFQPHLAEIETLRTVVDEGLALIYLQIMTLMTAYQTVAAAAPILAAPSTTVPAPPYTLSLPVTTALARLTEDQSRGTRLGSVDINDLLFTARDVAYLLRSGYVFTPQGTLVLRVSPFSE
jgi:hypothetical protein